MTATLVSTWKSARERLIAAGVDSPVLDARMLIEAGAGVARIDIVTDPHRVLTREQARAVEALLSRREAREPISHILGRKAFWTIELAVSPAVLTPRPETELLVEWALQALPADRPVRVLDLGVGSGAILLALLSERPAWSGIGVDREARAIAMAQANAAALGVSDRAAFLLGEWDRARGETFDLVLSNPPYIVSAEIEVLAPEVARYEPRAALDGGADGLCAYRAICPLLAHYLAPAGRFGLEIGEGQSAAVTDIARRAGLDVSAPLADLSGRARVLCGKVALTATI